MCAFCGPHFFRRFTPLCLGLRRGESNTLGRDTPRVDVRSSVRRSGFCSCLWRVQPRGTSSGLFWRRWMKSRARLSPSDLFSAPFRIAPQLTNDSRLMPFRFGRFFLSYPTSALRHTKFFSKFRGHPGEGSNTRLEPPLFGLHLAYTLTPLATNLRILPRLYVRCALSRARCWREVYNPVAALRKVGERSLRPPSNQLDKIAFDLFCFGIRQIFDKLGLWNSLAGRQHRADDPILVRGLAQRRAFMNVDAIAAPLADIERRHAIASKKRVDVKIPAGYRCISHLSAAWQVVRGSQRRRTRCGPRYSATARNSLAIPIFMGI
jgi:hypothetical protein